MTLRTLPTEKETREVLHWIVPLLRRNFIPFQIVGGLAARAYGSRRSLVDIDMYVPGNSFEILEKELRDLATTQHNGNQEDLWDLKYMSFFKGAQKVEIGDADDVKIFDRAMQTWIPQTIHFERSVELSIYEIKVPVMPKSQLIEYKKILGRPVDLEDIQSISNTSY